MKKFLLLSVIFLTVIANAQVGINTTTPNGALDVVSSTNGILVPRVLLTSTLVELPVVNPQGGTLTLSTLVYNSIAAGFAPNNVVPGYYYWNGSIWVQLTIGNDWKVNGNLGTNSTRDFVGTRDAQDFVFKTNNIERMRINSDGNVSIAVNNPSEKLDILGKIKMVDGNQADGKILRSDANGVASWSFNKSTNIVGVMGGGRNIPYNELSFLQTGSYIDLPPGKFLVTVNMLISDNGRVPTNGYFWLRTTFTETSFDAPGIGESPDIQGTNKLCSGNYSSNELYAILTGSLIINNASSVIKRYYYIAGKPNVFNTTQTLLNFGGSGWGEDNINATRIE